MRVGCCIYLAVFIAAPGVVSFTHRQAQSLRLPTKSRSGQTIVFSTEVEEVVNSEQIEEVVNNEERVVRSAQVKVLDNEVGGLGQSQILSVIADKIGSVDDERIIFPELSSGEVPNMFSSLEYSKSADGRVVSAQHAAGSTLGAAALVAGTTVGAGILALPTATAPAGFVASSGALGIAWFYMTISGLLIAELVLNQTALSGRPGLGLYKLYGSTLGPSLAAFGSLAYFFLHYTVMVAYVAQGGANVDAALIAAGLGNVASIPGIGQVLLTASCGLALYAAKPSLVEKVNNVLVFGVIASFAGIVATLVPTADFASLIDTTNQHPEEVVNCFPILFLSMVYQNVVPTIVTQLEGDKSKIVKAIIGGTTIPFIMFLVWNAVILGNASGATASSLEAMIQSSAASGTATTLVTWFSSLALITSVIGFTYGLQDGWTDVFNMPSEGQEFEKRKAGIMALVFLPPLALSLANPDIFYTALNYGGAFGVSSLFLVLPPLMVWRERYGEEMKPIVTKPMVPLGKIPLASMWKAAATLIVEQSAEKLGIIEFLQQQWNEIS